MTGRLLSACYGCSASLKVDDPETKHTAALVPATPAPRPASLVFLLGEFCSLDTTGRVRTVLVIQPSNAKHKGSIVRELKRKVIRLFAL